MNNFCDGFVDNVYNKAIRKTLKQLRENKKYSFKQLAVMMNKKISRQTLHHYESGKSRVRIDILKELAKIYNLTEKEMFYMITINYFIELNKYLEN